MAKEIERKFLIDRAHPDVIALINTQPRLIRQGYIMSGPAGVVRVRIDDNQALLTIKGITTGISRDEFEYQIPNDDAEHLLTTMCGKVIEKRRYICFLEGNLTVELDVFPQIDLYLAEVELPSEATIFEKPDWFGEDVSSKPRYFNNNIANRL